MRRRCFCDDISLHVDGIYGVTHMALHSAEFSLYFAQKQMVLTGIGHVRFFKNTGRACVSLNIA